MASSISFVGDFIYQGDVKVPRGRKSRRLDIIGRHEFSLPLLDRSEVDPDAVVMRAWPGKQVTHMTGWNGRLWLPMEAPRRLFSDKPVPLDVKRLAEGCVFDPGARHSFLREDPMLLGNRFSAGRVAPHSNFQPKKGTTVKEAEFSGRLLWSNKPEAIRRYEAAARNLIVIGQTVYCHAHAPCWVVNPDQGAPTFLTIPSYLVTDVMDVVPQCGVYQMSRLETFGLNNRDQAIALSSDRRIEGEVIAFDPAYAERDEIAWRLYPRIEVLKHHGRRFVDFMTPDGAHSLKVLTDLWREADFHDLSRFTQCRPEILAHLALVADELKHRPMPAVRLSWRDWVLPRLEQALVSCRRIEGLDAPSLSPTEAEALAAMAPM